MEDNSNEYKRKLFDIINAIDYFSHESLKNGRVILIGGKQSKIIKENLFFSCVCTKLLTTLCK